MGDLGGWGTDGDGEEISARPDVLDVEIPGGEQDGFAHQSDLEVTMRTVLAIPSAAPGFGLLQNLWRV
jgi:hypothetical protein